MFREKITFALKKIVYIYIDYINFSKDRSFIMITTYLIIFNIITDSITLKIAIFVNSIDKPLKIYKNIYLNIIYKFVKTIYFLIDVFKIVTVLTITTTTFSEPLS